MMWYNLDTGALQSNNPAGGWASDDYMRRNFPMWTRVADDFEPPVREAEEVVEKQPEPTKEDLLAELDEEYEASKGELANAYLDAVLHNDNELAESIKAELAELDVAYDENRREIEGE